MSAAPFRAERPDANSGGPYYNWEVPGKPVSVRLALSVIDRLEGAALESFRSLTSRGSEMGGILWGSVVQGKPAVVTVTEFEPITCDYSRGPLYRLSDADTGRFDSSIERASAKGLSAVGFFRSHTRKDLALDEDDIALFNSRFKEHWKIALLIRPFATKTSVAGIFIRENGRIAAEASCLEFPFQSAELTKQSNAVPAMRPAAAAHPAPAPAPAAKPIPAAPVASRVKITLPDPPAPPPVIAQEPVPEPVQKQEAPEERVRPVAKVQHEPAPMHISEAPIPDASTDFEDEDDTEELEATSPGGDAAPNALMGLLKKRWVLVAAGAVLLLCSGLLFVSGVFRSTARPPVSLTLRIERTAGDLLLTWNRESEAIRNARQAVLSIYDGERTENYQMDLGQLRNGSIVYSPLTADVSFKMEVTGPDGSRVASESVRVLRTRPSPMPEDAAKAAQQAKKDAAPAAENAAAAAQQAPATPEAAAEEPAATAKLAQASRKFNVASLAQRLRPATDSDLPDAPVVGAAPVSAPVAGLNLPGNSGPSFPAAPRSASEGSAPTASKLQQAQVVSRVSPVYPALAQRANATGTVRLSATVGTDGKVKKVSVISGHPLLQQAATDAVRQWVYKPTLLNGKAVESEIEVALDFKR